MPAFSLRTSPFHRILNRRVSHSKTHMPHSSSTMRLQWIIMLLLKKIKHAHPDETGSQKVWGSSHTQGQITDLQSQIFPEFPTATFELNTLKSKYLATTTYVKQQKLDLKDRRYLVTYTACLQKSSWASILTNFTILLLYQYWLEWNKAHRILRCTRATFPALWRPCKDHPLLQPTEYYAVSQQEQSNPMQCIHQWCTFIYLMAESVMALEEILANFSLGVVSHSFVGL